MFSAPHALSFDVNTPSDSKEDEIKKKDTGNEIRIAGMFCFECTCGQRCDFSSGFLEVMQLAIKSIALADFGAVQDGDTTDASDQ